MNFAIHNEGFELTEAIRNSVNDHVEALRRSVPDRLALDVFLKQEAHNFFTCTMKAHVWKKDFVAKESGPDLYTLIVESSKNMERNIHKAKDKRRAIVRKHQVKQSQVAS